MLCVPGLRKNIPVWVLQYSPDSFADPELETVEFVLSNRYGPSRVFEREPHEPCVAALSLDLLLSLRMRHHPQCGGAVNTTGR